MQIDPKSALDISQTTLEMAEGQPKLKGLPQADPAAIKKVAQEFESLFLEIVLKSMRGTVSKSGLVDGGNGEEIFRSMLDGEYAKMMSTQGSAGLADSIASQMLSLVQSQSEKLSSRDGQAAYQKSAIGK